MAVFLTFNHTAVAGEEPTFAQRLVERVIIRIERTADAQANRASLAGKAATSHTMPHSSQRARRRRSAEGLTTINPLATPRR